MPSIRVGTRGSPLALIQARMFCERLEQLGFESEVVEIESEGDRDRVTPLREIRKKGIFSSTLNDKVISKEIDLAVHSAKDLPTFLPSDLEVAGVLPRGPPEDVLVSQFSLKDLPDGATIGTSSFRRKIEMKNQRPDLKIKEIRGNIETRVRKVAKGEYDGVVIAHAAFQRLHLKEKHEVLSMSEFPPAPNQGIIAATAIRGTTGFDAAARASDANTMRDLLTEKAFLENMKFSCDDPVSVFRHNDGQIDRLRVRIYSLSGAAFMDFEHAPAPSLASIISFAEEIKNKIPASYGYRW